MSIFQHAEFREARVRTVQAMLVHERDEAHYGGRAYFVTTHRVHETAAGPVIGEGRLLDGEDQHALAELLQDQPATADGNFLPPEVLSLSAQRMAWVVPGRVRPMYFRMEGKTERCLVPWPNLVFRVVAGHLALAAIVGSRRPRIGTPLYHAPLMNTYATTLLCTGTAEVPSGATLPDRAGYERAVFATNFSHTNHGATLRMAGVREVSDAAHVRFWRGLHRAGATRFPREALVPLGVKLGAWLHA